MTTQKFAEFDKNYGAQISSEHKALLKNLDTNEKIELVFNPTEYSLSKSNNWTQKPIVGFDVAPAEFTGGRPTQLKLDLFFDTYEKANQDVREYTNKVWDLAKISQKTQKSDTGRGRPPRCLFAWGKVFSFKAVITSISISYKLFLADGTPVRANMNLSLQESEDPKAQKGTNPTSVGTPGYKYHQVMPHDTIERIAYQEYGDPTLWRHIADVNELDNPSDLRHGDRLVIAPLQR